ncbi:MAG: hypothetical protein WBD02_05445 [Acidimicrobiia bacterium]
MKKAIMAAVVAAGLSATLTGCAPGGYNPNKYGSAEILSTTTSEKLQVTVTQFPKSTGDWPTIRAKVVKNVNSFWITTWLWDVAPGETQRFNVYDETPLFGADEWVLYTCVVDKGDATDDCRLQDHWVAP